MKFARSLIQIVLIAAILAGGVAIFRTLQAQREEVTPEPVERTLPRVEVIAAVSSELSPLVVANGEVYPRTETDLVAEVSGRVLELHPEFAEGGFFEAGELSLIHI